MPEMTEIPWDKNADKYYEEWEIAELQKMAIFEKDQQELMLSKSEKSPGTHLSCDMAFHSLLEAHHELSVYPMIGKNAKFVFKRGQWCTTFNAHAHNCTTHRGHGPPILQASPNGANQMS
jgi:hypothetical protein